MSGRDGPAGKWTGEGITSSTLAEDPGRLVGLAVLRNVHRLGGTYFSFFGGQPVDVNSILVKRTWNGDANLDGRINSDDYFQIDSGFLARPDSPTYAQGDFNYDGLINSDDYFLIDSAFLGQAGQGSTRMQSVPVPEPRALMLVVFTALAWRRRRRR